jgi:hypothetical protein
MGGGFMADSWRIHGGFMADSWRIHGGFMADSWRIHGGFMANGFAKVDNGFGYEKWLQGGCIGLALL